MGAFSLNLREYDAGRLGDQKIPMELVHLPEEWKLYCREVQRESPSYLNLELEDEPPRELRCCMEPNGSPAVVRGIQRGNENSPVHGVHKDDFFSSRSTVGAWNELIGMHGWLRELS